MKPVTMMQPPEGYPEWLITLKNKIHHAQQQASRVVNQELIALYWHIGKEIRDRQTAQAWGAKVVERLAHDLRKAFPGMKGFSRSNLLYMRAFAEAWPDTKIVQQVVGHLPWGHNLILLSKLKRDIERALVQHVSDFLLEPGAGFAFVGRQT